MIVAWLAAAVAAEPTVEAVADEPTAEIVVYGDLLVERARQRVLDDLRSRGYTDVIERDGYVILRNDEAWKGDVIVHDDGWVRMKRQPLRLESRDLPWAEEGSPLAWASCALYPPMCVRSGGVLVSRRKFQAQVARTLEPMQGDIASLGDRVADRAVDDTVNDLPARLFALWNDGVPLADGAASLPTPEARRRALLDYWESRTDTVWGDRVRLAVEAFIRAEVQTGPFPYPPAEIAAFNARRTCTRALDLERPWDQVVAEVEASARAFGAASATP